MLRSTEVFNPRGFVFSLEVLLALLVISTVFASTTVLIYKESTSPLSKTYTLQLVDDSYNTLLKTGYLHQAIDDNGFVAAIDEIHAKTANLLPASYSFRIQMTEHYLDTANCETGKTFASCFPDVNRITISAGQGLPTDRDTIYLKKTFVRKQPPGQCDLDYEIELLPTQIPQQPAPIKILFQGDEDLNVQFDVNVTPEDVLECDETETVNLSAVVPLFGRAPVDVMLVIDRSGSMNSRTALLEQYIGTLGSGIYYGSETYQNSSGNLGGGTRECVQWGWWWCQQYDYANWQQLDTFTIDDTNEFEVLLSWTGNGGWGWHRPKMYIEAPDSTTYGFYGGTPPGGAYTTGSSSAYLEVPTNSSQNGTWTVYGWNDNPSVSYTLNITIHTEITYSDWQYIGDFDIEDPDGFMVYMNWTGSCSGNCPELYIESPTGATYGFYGGTPPGWDSQYTSTSTYNRIIADPSELGNWKIYEWNDDPAVTQTTQVYLRKMDAAQIAAKSFVNYPDWDSPVPGDKLGLVSYSYPATLNQGLLDATALNKSLISGKIDALDQGGYTATGDAMQLATNEIVSNGQPQPPAYRFQIVLSDGQTNKGMSTTTAANNAKDNNIIIYTIGLGDDARPEELIPIATTTGGKYYHADDANALEEVYKAIRGEIGTAASGGEKQEAYNAILYVPLADGTEVVDFGGSAIEKIGDLNYLRFYIGFVDYANPWYGSYQVMFPCNNEHTCEEPIKVFPPDGTYFEYDNNAGITQDDIYWDVNVVVDFKYRDLTVEIVNGTLMEPNLIYLNLNASNIGYLDSDATTVDFYLNDPYTPQAQFLKSEPVPALCPGIPGSCTFSITLSDVAVNLEGYVYAVINFDGSVRECPNNNMDSMYCFGAPSTKYYLMEYWVWSE